jgi:hypothetical protein
VCRAQKRHLIKASEVTCLYHKCALGFVRQERGSSPLLVRSSCCFFCFGGQNLSSTCTHSTRPAVGGRDTAHARACENIVAIIVIISRGVQMEDLSGKWCSWCSRKCAHLFVKSPLLPTGRNTHCCASCGKKTLPCRSCDDAMVKGGNYWDPDPCAVCDKSLKAWPLTPAEAVERRATLAAAAEARSKSKQPATRPKAASDGQQNQKTEQGQLLNPARWN